MKAIITDLDRTLLRTDKSVSEYTIETLNECKRRGMLVMAASARPLRYIQTYHERIGFDAATAANGAIVSVKGTVMEYGIPRENGERMLERILQYPDVFLSVETSSGLYSNRDIPEWNPVVYDQFPRLPDGAVLYKILVSSGQGAMYEGIKKDLTNDVYHTIANQKLVQIMSKEATKWNGVQKMLSAYGVSSKDCVYFGDDNDDLQPIIHCGLGIAVSNAIPSIINAADHIADSNDRDGAAKYIKEYILHESER